MAGEYEAVVRVCSAGPARRCDFLRGLGAVVGHVNGRPLGPFPAETLFAVGARPDPGRPDSFEVVFRYREGGWQTHEAPGGTKSYPEF